MPKYKNSFVAPDHFELKIAGEDGGKIGAIRIKPSSVLWKPKGQHEYYAVDLEIFHSWIVAPTTKARRTKS